MNIALFPSAFYPSLGGVEELVRQLAMQLRRDGEDVSVYTNRWPRNLPSTDTVDGLEVVRFPARVPAQNLRSRVSSRLTRGTVLRGLEHRLRAQNTQVINAHCVSCVTEYAMALAERMILPLVVTLQGELTMDAGQIFQKIPGAADLFRRSLRQADQVTAVSGKTLEDAERFLGESLGDKGQVIFNGACAADFTSVQATEHDRPYVFALGRLVPQKGFDLLLEAFAKAALNNVDLVLAGDGPDAESLKDLAKKLGILERVRFVGRQSHEQVVGWLKGSMMFVLSSRADEGLPVVIAEAMNAGAAIVATRSGGTPEVITDGEHGLLIDRGDVDQLAEAIERLGRDEALRLRVAAAAKETSACVEWKHLANQYANVYRKVLSPQEVLG